jgi:hypothetical protein
MWMVKESGFPALIRLVAEQWCIGSRMDGDGNTSDLRRFFPETGRVTADQFVEWVFRASGPDARGPAPMWKRAKAEIRAAFVTYMGAESVDVGDLRWDGPQPEFLPLPDPEAFTRNLTEEELRDYREEFGERSREWILAQNELRRRRSLPVWAALFVLGALLAALILW